MRNVEPEVFLVARPQIDYDAVAAYLREVGGESWLERLDKDDLDNDALNLAEFAGRLCYDPETEILTSSGWKRFDVLDQSLDRVLTWNRWAERAEFEPFSLVRYDYDGPMLRIAQRGLDLLVTPDHRMWAQKMKEGGGWSPWHFATAETVGTRGVWRFRRDCDPVNGSVEVAECLIPSRTYRSGPGGRITRETKELRLPVLDYAKFLGYVIAEGHTRISRNGAGSYVGITQKKGPVLDDIREIVSNLGLQWREYCDPRKPTVVTAHISGGSDFVRRVQKDAGTGARNKRIPRWLMEHKDRRVLEGLWEALWAGDGSTAAGTRVYDTASGGLAADVQELLLRLGSAASVSRYSQPSGEFYRVRVLQNGTIGSHGSARSWENYKGPVWCVSTANGIVYVRRNGHGVWCGNCYRSWEPGLNPNVSRVRAEQDVYLQNILSSAHGSVLEHVSFSFALHNVSRVCCYDDETEVLTTEGWKPWPKVEGNEIFGTLNPDSGELQFQSATKVFHGDYQGLMYRVRSEQVDLLVTPNHRMWVQRFDTQAAKRGEQKFGIERATDLLHKRVEYQKCARWVGHTHERVVIPETHRTYRRRDRSRPVTRTYPSVSFPLEPFAKFLGYYLAEGCTNGHQIIVAQNRGPILDRISETIREMGLPTYVPKTGNGEVRTHCLPLRDMLAALGHLHEKSIPPIVQGWAPAAIRLLLEAMIEGDGTVHSTNGHRVIYTSSQVMADDLQVLAIKAGWSANIRIDDRTGLERELANGQRIINRRPCYVVSLLTKRLTPLVNHRRHVVPNRDLNAAGYNDGFEHYEGRVHCVQVPNGLLFIRRNGKPAVSGNTHELVRHRPGVAISQESLRFVRLNDIPFWFPDWARADEELMERAAALLEQLEQFQLWMGDHFGLDNEGVPFHEKKHKTSFMRRFAPDGVATGLLWTANIRTLRHTVEARTDPGAEEEIRLLFGKIGELMRAEAPALFGDYTVTDGAWIPRWRKV